MFIACCIRTRSQPDLVAKNLRAVQNLKVDPRLLACVGVGQSHLGVFGSDPFREHDIATSGLVALRNGSDLLIRHRPRVVHDGSPSFEIECVS